MKRGFVTVVYLLIIGFLTSINAQSSISKVEPPHWWSNMKNDTLHLLFYGNKLDVKTITCDRKDVVIDNFRTSTNEDYLFVDLILANSTPGSIQFKIETKSKKLKWTYELKQRDENKIYPLGLNQSDLIYLIMPDRFSSENEENDSFDTMNQVGVYRDSLYERHGGDIKGITKHLDYIEELGISALWLNPIEENDQFHESYHGYAISNHYMIDPRLGSFSDYKELIDEGHKRGIKMIRDVIFNHFGDQHALIQNPPDSTWINYWDEYTRSTFRATVRLDPHASKTDTKRFSEGWFDHQMPDMNYKNKDLANYMIQNSIWWVEEFNIDAYRIDTYIYPDQDFMKNWGRALKEEYPNLFLFAETWVHGSSIQAWFAGGDRLNQGETYLDGVTDFQLYYAINNALNNSPGWNTGVSEIYYKLVDDVLYSNPENNVLFLDNHDLDRFYGSINQDFEKYKKGIALLFTLRGIPSIFYGTELLMPYKGEHGLLRTDFPGGWENDSLNKFEEEYRSQIENEAFNYVKYLANWRKGSPAIKDGKLIQFIPEDDHYIYARVADQEIVLVIINQGDLELEVVLKNYDEVLNGRRKYQVVLEQMSYRESEVIEILPNSIQILSFRLHDENSTNNSTINTD